MSRQQKTVGIGLAIGLIMMSLLPPVAVGQHVLDSAQSNHVLLARHEETQQKQSPESDDPRAMSQGEWRALAKRVAMSLDWIGIQMGVDPYLRGVYVPALTQEYLQAFQLSLMQGATKQQADILASRHVYARIQQLTGAGGSGGQRGDGCTYDRSGAAFCSGSDGFRSFSPPPGSRMPGISTGP